MNIYRRIAISTIVFFLAVASSACSDTSKSSPPATIGDVCRAYALAIEAVAEARDNLGQPSWDELVEQHPILEKNGENDRAVTYALTISLGVLGKTASPQALKTNFYDQCPMNFLCLHRGVDCGPE